MVQNTPKPVKNILVVEDDEITANFMKIVLEGEGYAVMISTTPFYAISSMVRFDPDMIIMDVRLPSDGVDGIDVYEIIKNHFEKNSKELPIIIVSGQRDQNVKDKAMQAGAKSYIEKPFEPETLLAMVSAGG